MLKLSAALLAVLALGGCGEADPQQAVANVDCREVAPDVTERIGASLTINGGSVRNARAVLSGSHSNAYFVSAEIDGPGLGGDGHVGTWFTTNIQGPGMTFAVPEIATGFSDYGDASKTEAAATMSDPGAWDSRNCVRAAQAG